jgi:Fe-S-cluster containining protein
MDQLLAGPIPIETVATCDDCAMAAPPEAQSSVSTPFFDSLLKCCTYMPTLPNFIVGRILGDSDLPEKARDAMQTRLRATGATTPLGLSMNATYALLYEHQGANVFGRSESLRCPHLLEEGGGRCGIWQHRNSVCATYFCKFVRGAVGEQFWNAMRELLSAVEKDLAWWCLLELDLGRAALQSFVATWKGSNNTQRLDAHAIAGRRDPAQYKLIWGNWFGREQEFYRECGRLVGTLDWSTVMSVCGPEAGVRAQLVRHAYRELLSEEIPETLKAANLNLHFINQDSCKVASYSSLDPIAITKILLDLLPYFDGRPTDEVLSIIRKEKHIKIDQALVRRLSDFRILVAGD